MGLAHDLAVLLEELLGCLFENNASQGCRFSLQGNGELAADVGPPFRVTGDGRADLVRSDSMMALGQARNGDRPVVQGLGLSCAVNRDGRERNVIRYHCVQGRVDDDAYIFLDDHPADGLQLLHRVRGDERVAGHGQQQRAQLLTVGLYRPAQVPGVDLAIAIGRRREEPD